MQQQYGFASQVEHEGIVARLYGGRRTRTEHGRLPGMPHPRYGFLLLHADAVKPGDKGRYVPDTESIDGNSQHAAAVVVGYIFEPCLAGLSTQAIARRLEREGVPSPA
ncbi:MAG TPA: hypothetical protein VGP82_18405 [Ktedonobacterales bacterium]|jgi:hypothetical protein|nr:hypothetical protein [Ktedonobacterales bacterium]